MARIISLFIIIIISNVTLAFSQETLGKIMLKVYGIDPAREGKVLVGLFNNKTDYLKKAFRNAVIPISQEDSVLVEFENIPTGIYVLSVLHDLDDNQNMSFSFLGLPKEEYGFSNNVRGFFSAPSFEKASFQISPNQILSLEIEIR